MISVSRGEPKQEAGQQAAQPEAEPQQEPQSQQTLSADAVRGTDFSGVE